MSHITRCLKPLSAAAVIFCLAASPVLAEQANPAADISASPSDGQPDAPVSSDPISPGGDISGQPADASADYGISAYTFLETLTGNWPNRTNEENSRSQADIDAGLWIKSQLESFGYTVQSQDYVHINYTGTNYYAAKEGASDKIICIGAHYDCVDTTGTDDNGSGVSVLLELAQRFAGADTPCTLQFVFFDNEEHGGFVGSYNYVNYVLKEQLLLDNVICYINLDSVGGGDRLYAYGGVYEDDDTLTQIWPLLVAQSAADLAGVDLYKLPAEVATQADESIAFRTPTRNSGSDHYYFMEEGIPYVYFEAGLWCDDDGSGGNDETHLTCHYQTADPAFASTGGQIMHTEFDNLATLNELLPGRVQTNLSNTSRIVSAMLTEITEQTPQDMSALTYEPERPTSPEDDFTEPFTDESTTEAETESTSAAEDAPLVSNHSLIIIIFSFAAAVVLLLIGFVIYTSSDSTRRKRRRRRLNQKRRKKKNKRF